MFNFVAYKEGYNPRTLFKIFVNKGYHYDSSWLSNYFVEQCLINTQDYAPFAYTPTGFNLWLDRLYDKALNSAKQPHYLDGGLLPNGRRVEPFNNSAVYDFLFQRVVSNANDTAFLAEIGGRGVTEPIEALLQKIKYEESGAGDCSLNHSNVYRKAILDLGFSLPDPENLAEDKRLLDVAYADAAYQLAISRFPKRYLPEIIGMAIMLEWTGSPEALAIKKLLDGRNIDSTFYKMHVLADNKVNGHASDIRDAVPQYLERIRVESGEAEMQKHWQRIYQGYSTWLQIINDFELELACYLVDRHQNKLAA